jgi:hypothetical protein
MITLVWRAHPRLVLLAILVGLLAGLGMMETPSTPLVYHWQRYAQVDNRVWYQCWSDQPAAVDLSHCAGLPYP